MADISTLHPVSRSSSGFAQAQIRVIMAPTAAVLDDAAVTNVTLLRATREAMNAFEATGRAARAFAFGEANALMSDVLELGLCAVWLRPIEEMIGLQEKFARRRIEAATAFAALVMTTPGSRTSIAREGELRQSAA